MNFFREIDKRKIILILLFLTGVITRYPISERFMSHTDASSLTLALTQYNLLQETPAPPGYPLYFAIAAFINYFFRNPYASLIFESAIFSGIGACAFYLFGKTLGGIKVGLISSILFLTAPSFYFFGLTVYPYIVVISIYTLFIRSSYKIVIKNNQEWLPFAILYGLLIGIRPQELITTLPLFLFTLCFLTAKNKLKTLTVFLLFTALWLLPFLAFVGGLKNYIEISSYAASVAIPKPSLTKFISKRFELLSGLYLTLSAVLLPLLVFIVILVKDFLKGKKKKINRRFLIFSAVWVFPVIIFNFFIRTEHVGYQSGYLIFLLFISAMAISRIFKNTKTIIIVVVILAFINLFIFFQDRDPSYKKTYRQSSFHYSDLRRNDFELENKIKYIKRNFKPDNTIIIAGPYFWRHARYYLPEYLIYEIDALTSTGNNADTRRDAKNLQFKVYQSKEHFFVVPNNVQHLVLFDNEMDDWVKGDKKVIIFKGEVKLTILRVAPKDVVKYDFNRIQIAVK